MLESNSLSNARHTAEVGPGGCIVYCVSTPCHGRRPQFWLAGFRSNWQVRNNQEYVEDSYSIHWLPLLCNFAELFPSKVLGAFITARCCTRVRLTRLASAVRASKHPKTP
jgi:hypothetical protein